MIDASRVKEWASCNWRFKYFPGLRIKLTQSKMDERGRWFGCIGHGEVSHIDSVMGHWVKMWSVDSSWSLHKWQVVSIARIPTAKVTFVGRMSQAIFHKSILWRGLILAFQRMFQSDLAREPEAAGLSYPKNHKNRSKMYIFWFTIFPYYYIITLLYHIPKPLFLIYVKNC